MNMPKTPFSTRLSGLEKETELRLRSIFQWKKKRPPVVLFVLTALVVLLCFSLFSCVAEEPEQDEQNPIAENTFSPDEPAEETPAGKNPLVEQGTKTESSVEYERYKEQITDTLSKIGSTHVKSALLDGDTILVPGMRFATIAEGYRNNLVLVDGDGRLLEGDPDRDQSVVKTYENENVTIKTVAFTENAVLYDGKIPTDIGVEYIESILVKNDQVTTLICGLKIGDPSPFGAGDEGEFEYSGRPAMRYSYRDNVLTGLYAYCGMDLMSYQTYADMPDLQLTYDENGFVNGTKLRSESAKQEVLNYAQALLAEENFRIWCWLSNGSGPLSVSMDGQENAILKLLSGYQWQQVTEKDPEREGVWAPGDWNMWLGGDLSSKIDITTYGEYIDIMIPVNGSQPLTYTAEGVSELPERLADLYPGPEIRFHLVDVPNSAVTSGEEIAAVWAEGFEQLYMESGHIKDFELRKLATLRFVQEGQVDSGYSRHILVNFAVKPADLSDPYWRRNPPDDDGWVVFRDDLTLSMRLDEDGMWRCDWIM